MAYTFDKANANQPSARVTQYFEIFGMRALYHEGWIASTTPYRAPWEITLPTPADIVNGVKSELYNIEKDWTQFDDVAAANPPKLKELQDLFWVEAQKYQVLPLDASGFTRVVALRPSITAGRSEFTYVKPMTGILPGDEPNILNKSYVIAADITVPAGGGDGMLVTDGGRLILLDTCESGALVVGRASGTDAGNSEASLGRLNEATGRPVLTAAAANQVALEGYRGHGVFT